MARVYGDTVVITGRNAWRGTAVGHAFIGVLVTTLALHRDGQWQIAASYSSSVPPAQGAPLPLK